MMKFGGGRVRACPVSSCEAGSARTHVTNLLGAGYELVPGDRIQMMCHAEEGKGLAGPTC